MNPRDAVSLSIRIIVAAFVTMAFAAPAQAAKKLPAKTTLEEFVAFMNKAVGDAADARAKTEGPLGPGFTISAGGREFDYAENVLAGKTPAEVMAALVKNYASFCEDPKTEDIARQDLGGVQVLRVAITCSMVGHANYAEAVVIADGDRFQEFDFGGFAENKAKTVVVGEKLVNALAAAYR